VFRAKLILMLAEGASFRAITRQLQTTAPTIIRWKQRFRQFGLDGLDTIIRGTQYADSRATRQHPVRHAERAQYAALNTATGRVHAKTAAHHTSREFVAFV
jgi:transposase